MIALAQSPSTAQWSAFSHINEGGNHTIHYSVMNNNYNNNNNNIQDNKKSDDLKLCQPNSSMK